MLQNILNEFNHTNPWGITVQATAYDGISWLEEAMEAALIAGSPPDLLVGYNYQALHWDASGRVLVDLNEYAGDLTWGLSAEEQTDFYPAFWSQDITAGTTGQSKRFGLPLHRSALVLYYNQSFAQSLGFTGLPDTTYALRVRACAAAEANASDGQTSNDGTGGWLMTPQPSCWSARSMPLAASSPAPMGAATSFNTPQSGQALDYLKGLQDSGCAFQAAGLLTPPAEFAARRALFFAGSLSELPAVEAAFAAAGNRDTWSILPFPRRGD